MTVLGLNMFLHIGLGYFPQVFHKYSMVCYCHGIFSYFVTGFWKGFFFFIFTVNCIFLLSRRKVQKNESPNCSIVADVLSTKDYLKMEYGLKVLSPSVYQIWGKISLAQASSPHFWEVATSYEGVSKKRN